MKTLRLDGQWKIRWCDGQRGGMPHYLHQAGEDKEAYVKNLPREIAEEEHNPRFWMDATVPGAVHLDLVRAGVIDSPYEELGVLKCRWVEECLWFYRREFDAGEIWNARHVLLVLEGLDYGAVVFLNGKEAGRHSNAFYPCEIDATGLLRPEGNVLTVQLESGLYSVAEKPVRDYYTATMTVDILLHKRNWLRKTQSQMAWDWSPRLMNIGIGGSVVLLADDDLLIRSVALTPSVDRDFREGHVRVRAFASGYQGGCGRPAADAPAATMEITIDGRNHAFSFDAIPQHGVLEADVTVDAPRLWWPAGFGDQHRYGLTVRVLVGGRTVYQTERWIGFRHVEVDQSPHPEKGRYFRFIVIHAGRQSGTQRSFYGRHDTGPLPAPAGTGQRSELQFPPRLGRRTL